MLINISNNFDLVRIFEQKLCEYTGFKYAVCTDCCTNAILISLELLARNNIINKKEIILDIPEQTYMSIPMTLINNNWNIKLKSINWQSHYNITPYVVDAAVGFKQNMVHFYNDNQLVCVSFQQKKRLALGRGGAILFNDKKYLDSLQRMVYDGRNPYISDTIEVLDNNKIILGYHCYMEPDKAAQGILKLNQAQLLPEFKYITNKDYPNLKNLNCLKDYSNG